MLDRFKLFFLGYLVLEIKGRRYVKLLNNLNRQNYKLQDIKLADNKLYCKIYYQDWEEIKKICRHNGYQASIVEQQGVRSLLNKLRARKFLLIGILVMIILLHLIPEFLLTVKLKGIEELDKREIKKQLQEQGVRLGARKNALKLEEIETELLNNNPLITWVELSYQGTELVVEILEKEELEFEDKVKELIAAREGIVTDIIVLKGGAVVERGDIVKKGDLLISNLVSYQKDDQLKQDVADQARGVVEARTWYEGYGEASLEKNHKQLIAQSRVDIIINWQDDEYFLKGDNTPPFANFEVVEEIKRVPKWRNINLSLELITRRYNKVITYKEERDFAIAKKIAKERAKKSILQQLTKKAIILDSNFKIIETNDGLIRVKALIEVRENIAVRKE